MRKIILWYGHGQLRKPQEGQNCVLLREKICKYSVYIILHRDFNNKKLRIKHIIDTLLSEQSESGCLYNLAAYIAPQPLEYTKKTLMCKIYNQLFRPKKCDQMSALKLNVFSTSTLVSARWLGC